ncbi:hypothetical protein [Mucilaginibacter arboris]|uniref:Uncharacterized protein n=1 Tax=Mucilaginibacter arboris TaxID=2682090 RepID=A0A7K1SXS8_9SPHI|nr:hypothetical protein [Mucilaginibacter arboris]MVN22122.1 hypothetical protein [Mucilaginibacter arboris]
MESIVIHPNNKKDLDLLQYLAQKMGLETHILTESEKEDFALMKAMQENDPAENLSLEDATAYYQTLEKAK